MEEVEKKVCKACGISKELSEYGVNSKYKDKLQPKCNVCIKNKTHIFVDSGEPNCYIYQHLKLSGEIFYIGIGSGDNNFKRAYAKTGRNRKWHVLVNEYGYKVEILKTDLTRTEAEEMEIELIAYFQREDCCNGILCNLTDGGGGNTGLQHSEETKAKMSEDRKGKNLGENNPMYGRKLSEAHKEKISTANKGRTWTDEQREKYIKTKTGVSYFTEESKKKLSNSLKEFYKTHDGFNKGKPMSEETKKKLSEAHKGKDGMKGEDNPMYGKTGELNPMWGKTHTEGVKQTLREHRRKKVINIETKEIFDCAEHAGETIGVKGITLQLFFRGKSSTRYPFMYLESYEQGEVIALKEDKLRKPVINTETLQIYESISKAGSATGLTSISYHLQNKTNKLSFMYLSEYIILNPGFKYD